MSVHKVVITGPESTGKTCLAERLAIHFNTEWVPEYARGYIASLNREYNYSDVEHIAREQIRREQYYEKRVDGVLFFDTHLIITKIWFKVVYKTYPKWIDQAIVDSGTGLFLVCNNDIPWVPDPLRENGGEMREVLLGYYVNEIKTLGIPWKMVTGEGWDRTDSAIEAVKSFLKI